MTSTLLKQPRRFAPLGIKDADGGELPKLKGIVFDVDGTLWYDHSLFFLEFVTLSLVCSLACYVAVIFGGQEVLGEFAYLDVKV